MDLRSRYLFWIDILMFMIGFSLSFVAIVTWAGPAGGNQQAGEADRVWEDRLERSEPSVRDRSLTAAVETALDLTPEVVGFDLSASTDDRVVTIRGKVPSREKAEAALDAARNTPGVETVVDRIEIDPSVRPSQGRADQPQALAE